MKIFITGTTGYIGNRLASRIAEEEHEIHLLVRNLNTPHLPKGKNIHYHLGDITKAETILPAMQGCSQVYHCAALTSLDPARLKATYEINVTGTQHVLEASLKSNIEKLVFTSSVGVFGPSLDRPLSETDSRIEPFESDYDISKQKGEALLQEYVKKGLNAVIVNPSRVFGPGPAAYSNAVNRMIEFLLSKRFIAFPAIDSYRANYTYIGDLVEGHIKAMQKGESGENYILGGENISYGELQEKLVRYTHSKTHILKIPIGPMKGLAFIAGLVNKNIELTPSILTRFAKNRMVSSQKAISQLGYQITPIEKAIEKTVEFIKINRLQKQLPSHNIYSSI